VSFRCLELRFSTGAQRLRFQAALSVSFLDGASFLSSWSRKFAGIGCSLNSKVILQAGSGESLSAASSGIGAPGNGSMTILNVSFDVRDGVGLGVGWEEYGEVSRMGRLTIYGGNVQTKGINDGSGIGSGWGYWGDFDD
jgi:hypothetical protein